MSPFSRKAVLFGDAVFLLLAGLGGAASDIAGTFYGVGPTATMMQQLPAAGIGFIEAHGLAVVVGVMLMLAARRPSPRQHVAAAGAHLLLGICNLVFWDLTFVAYGMLTVGFVTTALHFTFVGLQLLAAPGHGWARQAQAM